MFKRVVQFSLFVALIAPAAKADEPKLADLVNERQQINLAFDQLGKCNRRAPSLAYSVMAALWQVDDIAKLRFGEAGAKAVSDAAELPKPVCDSQPDQQLKFLSHRHGFEWLTRLAVARAVSQQNGWSNQLADIATLPPQIEALRKQLGSNMAAVHGAEALNGAVQQYKNETETELALICEERKMLRTKAPRVCPTLPANLLQHRALAALRIANLELMVKRMAEIDTARNSIANPFGEPFGFYQQSDYQLWPHRFLASCTASQVVVFLTDPAAVRSGADFILPRRVFGTGEIVGQVTIKPDNAAYAQRLLIASGAPARNGNDAATISILGTEQEFRRCPNPLPK